MAYERSQISSPLPLLGLLCPFRYAVPVSECLSQTSQSGYTTLSQGEPVGGCAGTVRVGRGVAPWALVRIPASGLV